MIRSLVKEFSLTPESCDQIANDITAFCDDSGIERKDMLKCRLSVDECLVHWLDNGMQGNAVELRAGRNLLTPFVQIEVEGKSLNPYAVTDDDFGILAQGILVNLGLDPDYSYANGRNRIRYLLKRREMSLVLKLCLVILCALIVGVLGLVLIPDAVRGGIQDSLLAPLYATFFNLLGCLAGPMVFLSVAWGVYGIGDAATFGRIGKRMLVRYVGIVLVTALCGAVTYPLLGPALSTEGSGEAQLSAISELILGIVPSTIVEPFATGNTLQIIFGAVVIGIALLYLGRQTRAIALGIEQVNTLVQFLMEAISRLVPYVIFLVIVNLIWSNELEKLATTWKLLVVAAVAMCLVSATFVAITSVRLRVSPLKLAAKSMPTFLVALSTASSAASFNSHLRTCEDEFGIDPSLTKFGIPLGMVMHKPITAVYNLMVVFFFAERFGTACSITWIGVAVFVCAIVSIAIPPIPGGGAMAYSILFLQLGIPMEATAIALAIDVITDFFITACEMLVLPMSLLQVASRLGMVNKDMLKS